jgi:glycosyltransferase involved in cell wall biosynthesis
MNERSKPSLAVDARLLNASGIGTVLQNVLPFLKQDFSLVLLGDRSEIEYYKWAENISIIPINCPIYSLKEQFVLPFSVPKTDYFLSPHYNIPLLPIRAKRRLVIIHDVNHLALNITSGIVKRAYAQFVIDQAISLSDNVFTVSNFSKKEIHKYCRVKNKDIEVLPLGVDKNIFKPYPSAELEAVKNKLNLPDSFLLYLGNVKPHKNLICLLKALKILKSSGLSEIKLVIVGKKEGFITEESSIYNFIREEGLQDNILFTGFIPNEQVPALYNLAKIFIFPSLYEGFGLPPIEAMACGCPTIVSSAASLPEICQDACVYFNPNDPAELAGKIKLLLNDGQLRSQLVNQGLELVQHYNWEKAALQFKNIILSQ